CIFELFVFEKLPHQFLAGVALLVDGFGVSRQEHLALDLHKRGRHHQKVPGQLHIDQLNEAHVIEELPGHACDRDVADIDLVVLDQIEEEVERTAKSVEVDLVIHSSLVPCPWLVLLVLDPSWQGTRVNEPRTYSLGNGGVQSVMSSRVWAV